MPLPNLSIKRPVTITMFYLGIAFLGFYAFSRIGVDLLPNVNLPHLMVQTTYPDASPEEVEKLVTEPLESAVGTVTGVKKITSVSKEGISVISVDFIWGTDMNMAMLAMREKLDNIRFVLPREAGRPTIVKSDPSASPIMSLVLAYRNRNLEFGRKRGEGGTNELRTNEFRTSERKTDELRTDELRTSERRTNEWRTTNAEQRIENFEVAHERFVTHDSPYPVIKRLIDLKEAGRVIFKRRFEQLNGVAQTVVTGGLEREILVNVHPGKLTAYGISFGEIENALKSANINLPSGSIMKGLFRYSLRTIGEFKNVDEIGNTVIKRGSGGNIIYLKDIAVVKENFKERKGLTRLNGMETVGLLVYKEPEANTVTVASEIKQTLASLAKEYPEYQLVIVSDQSKFIRNSITNVQQAIFYGGILAIFVLFFFLRSTRNIFVVALTIPASLVLTVLLMFLFNISFNIISLGGVAVGIGMLLDNAIIVLENIVRRRGQGLSLRNSALVGTEEVTMPIIAATLTTLAVFIPLLFIEGIAGELFKDQSYAIIFSLSASVIASVTFIPMLASRRNVFAKRGISLRNNEFANKSLRENSKKRKLIFYIKNIIINIKKFIYKIIGKIWNPISTITGAFLNKIFSFSGNLLQKTMAHYEKLLKWALNNRKKILGITLILLFLAIVSFFNLKKEFIPPSPQTEFIIELDYPAGTSLRGNAGLTTKIERKVLSVEHVENVVANIGRVNEFDFLNKNQMDVNKTNLVVKLDSYEHFYSVQDKLSKMLNNLGNIKYSFKEIKTTYSELINPSENDIIIKIKNKNLNVAYETANRFLEKINGANIKGITGLRFGVEKATPEFVIKINREKCAAQGVNVNDVANQIIYQSKGKRATSFSDFDKKINVVIHTPESSRDDINDILNSYIKVKKRELLVRDLVDYNFVESYNEIWHENQTRTVFLYADINNINLDDALEKLNGIKNQLPVKAGQVISIGGTNEEIRASFSKLYVTLLISLFLMYMVLAMEFESYLFPFIIILSVPLGLIGGILALFVAGQSINVISLIGLIILMGIANNDAVVKVDFIIRKRLAGASLRDAIYQAGKERFRPIVMTSLTTIFGLIPMIIGFGEGTQLRKSLSIAIAGGLVTSTLLTLVIIPVIYSYLEKWSTKFN